MLDIICEEQTKWEWSVDKSTVYKVIVSIDGLWVIDGDIEGGDIEAV